MISLTLPICTESGEPPYHPLTGCCDISVVSLSYLPSLSYLWMDMGMEEGTGVVVVFSLPALPYMPALPPTTHTVAPLPASVHTYAILPCLALPSLPLPLLCMCTHLYTYVFLCTSLSFTPYTFLSHTSVLLSVSLPACLLTTMLLACLPPPFPSFLPLPCLSLPCCYTSLRISPFLSLSSHISISLHMSYLSHISYIHLISLHVYHHTHIFTFSPCPCLLPPVHISLLYIYRFFLFSVCLFCFIFMPALPCMTRAAQRRRITRAFRARAHRQRNNNVTCAHAHACGAYARTRRRADACAHA